MPHNRVFKEIPLSYSPTEYNQLIKEIQYLKKRLSKAYELCEHICEDASKSSWLIRTPKQMASHCAKLIRSKSNRTPNLIDLNVY